jgi:hypothetical protein
MARAYGRILTALSGDFGTAQMPHHKLRHSNAQRGDVKGPRGFVRSTHRPYSTSPSRPRGLGGAQPVLPAEEEAAEQVGQQGRHAPFSTLLAGRGRASCSAVFDAMVYQKSRTSPNQASVFNRRRVLLHHHRSCW